MRCGGPEKKGPAPFSPTASGRLDGENGENREPKLDNRKSLKLPIGGAFRRLKCDQAIRL